MKLKIALTPLVDITAEDCLALIAMGKVRANKFEGQRKREVYTQGNYTGTLKVDVTTATLLLTVIAPALAFIPRSGHLEDTPFWYGSKQEVDYTPAINGTSWIYTDQIKAMPALRTEVPMLSAGNGMQAIFADGDITLDFVGYKNNFGNLWWASTDGKYACSWNGPYSRLFTDIYRNTVGNDIYVLGDLITGPEYEDFNVVLGASCPEGQLYAITYNAPVVGKQAVSKYVNGEWIKLGDLESSYSKQAWFADPTGLIFTHPKGHKVTISGNTIIEEIYTPPVGSQNETYVTGHMPTFTKEYEGASLFEGNVVGNLTLTQNISTTNTGSSNSTSSEFSVESIVITDDFIRINGPEFITVGSVYSIVYSGTYCSVNWNFKGSYTESTSNGSSITVTSLSGCGTGTITATIEGGGNSGISTSRDVMYPDGTWIWVRDVGTQSSVCNDYGMPAIVTFITGSTKKVAVVYWGPMGLGSTCNYGVPVSGTSGGMTLVDGSHTLSLPKQTAPYPNNIPCGNIPCGGYQGWSGCGVCGSCTNQPNAPNCYYAEGYSEYTWVC